MFVRTGVTLALPKLVIYPLDTTEELGAAVFIIIKVVLEITVVV